VELKPAADRRIFEAVKPRTLVRICAWCPDFDPSDPKNAGATHGMCDACQAAWWMEYLRGRS